MPPWKLGGLIGANTVKFKAVSSPTKDLPYTNRLYISTSDFASLTSASTSKQETNDIPAIINDKHVYLISSHPHIQRGEMAFGKIPRSDLRVALADTVSMIPLTKKQQKAAAVTFEISPVRTTSAVFELEMDYVVEACMRRLSRQIPSLGQRYLVQLPEGDFVFKTTSLVGTSGRVEMAEIGKDTMILVVKGPGTGVRIKGGDNRPKEIFKADFNFEKMGIGGLDKEFSDIFRRAFASRVFPSAVIQKLGISHVKGMLLYGPPGTGKTLIARQIGKMLNGKEPKVVNGPEILNKFVGQSEENIRNLFKDAEDEYAERGDGSDLHIIIFDEIDAICKQRGTVGNSAGGVHDTVVNQLLSKIDGVDSLNNILVIGMTNRKDMIDEALLRPGRLEVHVEISLPDEDGRQQILRIHTAKMRQNKMLGQDVDIPELAGGTKNYSGAELEGVCKSAAAFALNRHVDHQNLAKQVDAKDIRVGMDDFRRALIEVQPAFGMGKEDFTRCLLGGFITHGARMKHLVSAGELFRSEVSGSDRTPLLSVLLEGAPGTGKTALAAKLAVESKFPFVRLVSPENYVGYSEHSKCAALAKVFDDAHKSPLSVIVLDNIERMIDYAPIGPRFSNIVLQTLMVLIKQVPPKGRRLLIFGTTSCVEVMEALDLRPAFSAVLSTPALDREEIEAIVDGRAPSTTLNIENGEVDGVKEGSGMRGIAFASREERIRVIDMLTKEKLGIKKLLMILEMARMEGGNGGNDVVRIDRLRNVLRDVC